MATSDVDRLYQLDEVLATAGDSLATHEKEYKEVLSLVSGSTKAKQLSTTIIPKYFKPFPSLQNDAINAMLDLCEDEESAVRLYAIRALPLVCQAVPEFVPKIADVLGQLLQSEARLELDSVHASFRSLFRIDIRGALSALFTHIESGEEGLREAVITFVRDQILHNATELLHEHPDVEQYLTTLVRKILLDVSDKEFKDFLTMLKSLKRFQSDEGAQELGEIVAEQAGLSKEFKPTDPECIKRFEICFNMACQLFAKKVPTEKFTKYLVDQVLPRFAELKDQPKINILKSTAESSPYWTADEARALLPLIYALMKEQLPKKPEDETAEQPVLNFSHLECLLFTFHMIANKAPGALYPVCGIKIMTGQVRDFTLDDHSALKTDLDERTNYIAGYLKSYASKLNKAESNTKASLASATEAAEKEKLTGTLTGIRAAIRTMNNVLRLITPLQAKKDFSFANAKDVHLSWKTQPVQQPKGQQPQKQQQQGNKRGADEQGGRTKQQATGAQAKQPQAIQTKHHAELTQKKTKARTAEQKDQPAETTTAESTEAPSTSEDKTDEAQTAKKAKGLAHVYVPPHRGDTAVPEKEKTTGVKRGGGHRGGRGRGRFIRR